MNPAFFIGLFLLIISVVPLSFMGVELFCGNYARSHYRVTKIEKSEITFGEHKVRVDRTHIPPQITIDGRDFTSRTATEKCLFALLDDRKAKQQFVSITQTEPRGTDVANLHYRILRIPQHGEVREELFHMKQRFPLHRSMLIRWIHPQPIGYYSDLMQLYPTLFFPLLYPFFSGAAGFILTSIGSYALWRRRRLSLTPSQKN